MPRLFRKQVTSSSEVRPRALPAMISGRVVSLAMSTASVMAQPWPSVRSGSSRPLVAMCMGVASRVWITTLSALWIALVSISGRLIELRCTPGSTHGSKKMLSMELDAHITTSAPLTANSGVSTGVTSTPSVALISVEKAVRFSALGLKQRMVSMSRTVQMAVSWVPACQPDPRIPTHLASSRARYLAASPLVAPTRVRCITPSGKIARGSQFSVLNNSTSPT